MLPQVAKTFRKLQAAAVTNPEDAAAIAAATATDPVTLRGLPPAAFPLFTTTRQWLQLLDASCAEPFFARTADGALLTEGGRVEAADWDGIGLGVDLGGWGSDEEDEEEGGNEEDATPGEGAPQELLEGREGAGQAGGCCAQLMHRREMASPHIQPPDQVLQHNIDGVLFICVKRCIGYNSCPASWLETFLVQLCSHSEDRVPWMFLPYVKSIQMLLHTILLRFAGPARGQEITYAEFVSPAFWGRITRALGRQSFSREQRAAMRAPLVYQEIMSYIKGSAEALEAGGALSLEQYQQVRAQPVQGMQEQTFHVLSV